MDLWSLFTVSNAKLPFQSIRVCQGTGHADLQDQHLIQKRMQQVPS